MSYQPQPPMGFPPQAPPPGQPYGSVPMQQYGAAPVVAAPPPKRSKGLLFTGIAVASIGLLTGVVLFAMSGSTKEETVKKFARAPSGCTTTLQFDKRATFTLYVETKGSADIGEGDCSANTAAYDRGDDDLPQVALSLLDAADQEVSMSPAAGPSYSTGTYAGQAIQRVQITEPGTYRLTVTSDAADFAIAVGGDPDADAATMRIAGIASVIAGLLLGGLLLALGVRKKGGSAPSAAHWQPTGAGAAGWPPQTTVPGAVSAYQPQQPYGYSPQTVPSAPQPAAPQPAAPPTYSPPPAQPLPPRPPAEQGWAAPRPPD
ncbi:MAG: hypothetical protein WCC60_04165 [Ilumatobacteraceae bacterium]